MFLREPWAITLCGDQGLERLRQKVNERALLLSHQQAADVQQTRREAGSMIGELEAENAKLRADLAHRTSQLHSAVTRIGALKSRMDDLILQNDELMNRQERQNRQKVAARKRRQVLKDRTPGAHAHHTTAVASDFDDDDGVVYRDSGGDGGKSPSLGPPARARRRARSNVE